jgi:hypothetical protein
MKCHERECPNFDNAAQFFVMKKFCNLHRPGANLNGPPGVIVGTDDKE